MSLDGTKIDILKTAGGRTNCATKVNVKDLYPLPIKESGEYTPQEIFDWICPILSDVVNGDIKVTIFTKENIPETKCLKHWIQDLNDG